jgi:hypothetical protein
MLGFKYLYAKYLSKIISYVNLACSTAAKVVILEGPITLFLMFQNSELHY